MTERSSILICDDNQDFVRALTLLLRKEYRLITAKSVKGCVSAFSDALTCGDRVGLLILDYELGDAPARTVAEEVKRKSPETIILLITGYELDEPGVSKMFEEGLADYSLKKPFGLEEIKSNISAILSRG